MDIAANLDTAQLYLNTGLHERAGECLEAVLEGIPEAERGGDNPLYLRWVALRAKLDLLRGDRAACAARIDEGLALAPRHVDLLFLRTLIYWDCGRPDEMFVSLMDYLGGVAALTDGEQTHYEYAAPEVVREALGTLLPAAYREAPSRHAFRTVIERAAAASGHELFATVLALLDRLDGQDGDVVGEDREQEASADARH